MSIFFPSGWRFVTSDGEELSAGPLWSASLQNGTLYVRRENSREIHTLNYSAIGAGVSVGSPVNLGVSSRALPSEGEIVMGSMAVRTLAPRDFAGPCTILSGNLSALAADSGSVFMFGVSPGLVSGIVSVVLGGPIGSAVRDFARCKAIAFVAGLSVGIQAGVGVTLLRGMVWSRPQPWHIPVPPLP